MIPALIDFNFDPAFRLGDLAVRWETLALALTIVACVGLAAVIAGRTPAVNQAYPEMGGRERGAWHLRRDDLIYILLGVVSAAVLGGRLGYILIHWDFYSEHPGAWFDPTQGSLELSLAVVFGMMAGYAVAAGLGAPAGRWLHIATVPTLLGLTLGKFIGVLGGNGQGAEMDVAWATAYQGAGPWASLDPATPAHPSQIYEAVLTLLVLGLIVYLLRIGRFRDHDGRVFFAGISLWAIARVEAAFTWRDPEIFGPFRAGQVMALAIAVTCFGLFVLRAMYTGRTVRAILASRARVGRPATVPVPSGGIAASERAVRPVMEPVLEARRPVMQAGGIADGLAWASAPAMDAEEVAAAAAAGAAVLRAEEEARAAEIDARAAEEGAAALRIAAEVEAREAMLAREAEEAAAAAALPPAAEVVAVEALVPVAPVPGVVRPAFGPSSQRGMVWFERLDAVAVGTGPGVIPPAAPAVTPPAPVVSVPPVPAAPMPVVPVAPMAPPLAPMAPPVMVPSRPEVSTPRPVPSWLDLDRERLAPVASATGEPTEELMTEQGEPRRRTARELLAMAEAARRAQAERAATPAPVWTSTPTMGSVATPITPATPPLGAPAPEIPAPAGTPPVPIPTRAPVEVAAVLVEQLEAETHVPAGIVAHDPLAPQTDLFEAQPGIIRGPTVEASRVPSLAEGERVPTRPPAPEPAAMAPEPEPVTIEIVEHAPLVAAASRVDDPLAPQVDLFESMGMEGDVFTAPAGEVPTTPELERVADRAAAEFEAAREAGLPHDAEARAIYEVVREPEVVVEPVATAAPEPVAAPEPAAAPEPVAAPGPMAAPELEPVAVPEPVAMAEPEAVTVEAAPAAEPKAVAGEPMAVAEEPSEAELAPEPIPEPVHPPEPAPVPAPAPWHAEEPVERERHRVPYRPPLRPMRPGREPEAAPEPIAARLEPPAWEEVERRRPHVPIRSRRAFEERTRAEEPAASQPPQARTARGQRWAAEQEEEAHQRFEGDDRGLREHQRRLEREATLRQREAARLAEREAARLAEREAARRRMMRPRRGEGALEIEDIVDGDTEPGARSRAGQGADDRGDDAPG